MNACRTAQKILLIVCLLTASSVSVAGNKVTVQWLGHAAVKLTSLEGKVIVIDPFLKKNPKTPEKYKNLKELGKVDVILLTHGHFDHLADVVELSKLTGAKVAANAELVRNLAASGILDSNQIIAMNKSGIITPAGDKVKIHMVRAEHSSSIDMAKLVGNKLNGKEVKLHAYAGEPVGYVVEFENGFKVYHSGDTGVFGDMELIGKMYKPDVAMVCIGGIFTMNGEQAAYAMKNLMKPANIIPIHYGTFPILKGNVAQLRKAMGDSTIKILEMKPGDSVNF